MIDRALLAELNDFAVTAFTNGAKADALARRRGEAQWEMVADLHSDQALPLLSSYAQQDLRCLAMWVRHADPRVRLAARHLLLLLAREQSADAIRGAVRLLRRLLNTSPAAGPVTPEERPTDPPPRPPDAHRVASLDAPGAPQHAPLVERAGRTVRVLY